MKKLSEHKRASRGLRNSLRTLQRKREERKQSVSGVFGPRAGHRRLGRVLVGVGGSHLPVGNVDLLGLAVTLTA